MINKPLPAMIEDRIKRRERRGRNVRIDNPKSLYFKAGTGKEVTKPLSSGPFNWRCISFSAELPLLTGVNTAVSWNRLTQNHTDNGNGTYDPTTGEWTGTGKVWTINEWADHYLKVGDAYYKILSNTDDNPSVLTLDVETDQVIADGAYNIYPFIPNMLRGLILYPDTNSDRRFIVSVNTNTEIYTSRGTAVSRGTVTTGDAAGDYDTFRDSAFDSYENDHWDDYTLRFISGDNAGEHSNIDNFVGATGEFVLGTAMAATIDISDKFRILEGLLWVGVGATYKVGSGYSPKASDFAAADTEDIRFRDLATSSDGSLVDYGMDTPFVGKYSIEIYSEASKTFAVPFNPGRGSARVILTNLATDNAQILFTSSPLQSSGAIPITFTLSQRIWYRIDI